MITRPALRRLPALRTVSAGSVGVGAILAGALGIGLLTGQDPALTLLIALFSALLAVVLIRPELAGYLVVGATPLIAGINRGQGLSIFRPAEVLTAVVGFALVVGILLRRRAGGGRRLAVHPIEIAIVAMALANSVVPLGWMLLRGNPVGQDDLLYALVMWKLLGIYVIVRLSITRPEQVLRCLGVALAAGVVVAVVAILQSLDLFGVPKLLATYFAPFGDANVVQNGRGSSTLGLAAATADLLIFDLAIAVGLAVFRRRRRVLLGAVAALFVVGALSAGEFSSAIGLVVGVCAVAAVTGRPRLLWTFVPIGGVALLTLRPVIEKRLSEFGSVSGLPASWLGRLDNLQRYFWPKLLSGWNFVLGVQPAARVPVSTQATGYVWIESGYTWLLWGGGIPLLAAYLFLVRAALKASWRAARARHGAVSAAAVAVFVATGVMAVLMAFDPHVTYRGSAETYFALLAMAGIAWRAPEPGRQELPQPDSGTHSQYSWRPIMRNTNRSRHTATVGAASSRPARETPDFPLRSPSLLRTQLVWIILVTVVVTVGTAGYDLFQPRMYTAHTDVLVQPRLFSNQSVPVAPDMATELAVAMSGTVQAIAAQSRGLTPAQVARGWSVSVPANTHVLQFSHTSADPSRAQDLADAAAAAYVNYWQQRTPSSRDTRTGVITEASEPRSPSSPDVPLDMVIAVLVGLALGVGTAYLRDRFDDRLRSVQDLEAQSGVPLLGMIPAGRYPSADLRTRLVLRTDPRGELAAAYRRLRARILHVAARRQGKVLLVTSPGQVRHAVVAANLAVALAESGHTVSLVNLDVADQQTNELVEPRNQAGIADVLRDGFPPHEVLRETAVAGLSVLSSGANGTDHDSLLVGDALPPVLTSLSGKTGFVIVVAPPVLAGPDCGLISESVDLVLLVADAKDTTRGDVAEAVRRLAESTVVGCVLTNVGKPQPVRAPSSSVTSRAPSPVGASLDES